MFGESTPTEYLSLNQMPSFQSKPTAWMIRNTREYMRRLAIGLLYGSPYPSIQKSYILEISWQTKLETNWNNCLIYIRDI